MVLFVHCTFNLGCGYGVSRVQPYFYAGRMGVPLFFVISAFCLYGTYTSLTVRNSRTAMYAFWIKRICRIVPLWWIWVAVYAYWHAEPLRQALASALFYWGFARYGPLHDVFPGGWSLFVEETFYWLFPLLFPLVRTATRAVVGAVILFIVSIFWLSYGTVLGLPDSNDYLYYSPVNYWFCFFLGIACQQFFSNPTRRQALADWSVRYGGIAALVFVAGWFEWCTTSHRGTSLLFAGLVLVACSGTNWISRVVSVQPLRWLGKRCYSMYLCHFFILDYFPAKTIVPWSERLGLPPYVEVRLLVWFPIVVGAVALLSAITFVLVETPSIKLGSWLCARLDARMGSEELRGTRLLPRLQSNLAFRILVFVLAGSLFVWAVRLAWLAFSNPLELEIREGSLWLYVLAKRAGVDIYDTTRVAFVNMNHGPLDPIVKAWISRFAPALPGHMVTRIFVLLTPAFLLGSAYMICRRSLTAAMLAAGALYLLLLHVSPMLLVGRSDATAICGICICGVLTHELLVKRRWGWTSKSYIAKQIGLGAASSAVFLASWRCVPIIGAFQFIVLARQLGGSGGSVWPPSEPLLAGLRRLGFAAKQLTISASLYATGFAMVWVPTFVLELHGNPQSYYRHFFGFFSAKSGWGSFSGSEFHLVPGALVEPRIGLVLLFVALIVLGLGRLRAERVQFVAWLLMLSAVWAAVVYGYFVNEGGGGLHYFFEFFLFAWFFVLHALGGRTQWGPLAQFALVCSIGSVLPWRSLFYQQRLAYDARERARSFRQAVARRTQGQRIFGEETHLFKTKYHGEVVDTGDTAASIAESGYFGPEFSGTYQSYVRKLERVPPRFVLAGLLDEANWRGVMSPALEGSLKKHYRLVLVVQGSAFAYGGSQALFERKNSGREIELLLRGGRK
jgi:peptidoglycan/LPS O-acetylase OafA/YrhL